MLKNKLTGGKSTGLFRKHGKDRDGFFAWLDAILARELEVGIRAICFNLYEDVGNKWSVELVGTDSFEEDSDDWACREVFATRDHPFVIQRASDWRTMEGVFTDLMRDYLSHGKYAGKLKQYQAVGLGFVDGDLHVLYRA